MADIELVIKIPEEKYLYAKNLVNGGKETNPVVLAVGNGIPLPKGHGALKDVDNIKTAFPSGEYVRTESVRATIDHEDTIIEADKEEGEE